jgi:hypothetical protein
MVAPDSSFLAVTGDAHHGHDHGQGTVMVLSSHGLFAGLRHGASLALLMLAGACTMPQPVAVNATFVDTPAFRTRCPSQVAVLPVEDGTGGDSVGRLLVFLRQEVMRQLTGRLYTPITATTIDAALAGAPKPSAGESIVVPATLQKLAGHAGEEAVFALRVDRWDESGLHVDRKLPFQFQATLLGSDGVQLWSGTIQGEVKAGGAGASPRDKDGMARSCAELAVREMLVRLPNCPKPTDR